jgi:hypothetical protein
MQEKTGAPSQRKGQECARKLAQYGINKPKTLGPKTKGSALPII